MSGRRVQDILKLISQLDGDECKELFDRAPRIIERLPHFEETSVEEEPVLDSTSLACPHCQSAKVKPYGHYRGRQRFCCRSCSRTFTNFTGTSISGTHYPDKWQDFVDYMVAGKSVRYTADKLRISIPTAFSWRHKILAKYEKEADRALEGIVEADETFFLFSEKGDKEVSKRRKARKRGGKAKKPGISNEQIPVIAGCDRDGNVILGVAGRGRISMADVEEVLNNYIGSEVTLCTDAHRSFKAYAKAYKLSYVGLNISKGKRVLRKKYHIQNVNSVHSRLKQWMTRFHGVSTKYLQNYMNWFSLLEETKRDPKSQISEFTRRSLPSIP